MKPYRKIHLPPHFKEGTHSKPATDEDRRLAPIPILGNRINIATSCSENSILYRVPKGKLVEDIRKAAHRSGCRIHPAETIRHFFMMPGKLAIIDPTLLTEEEWNELCKVFHDAAPENIQFLLTGLSPHSATLPLHNVIPMPSTLDTRSLKGLIRQLRERPEDIRAFAPHYPFYLDQLEPGAEFTANEVLQVMADDHRELMEPAVACFHQSPDPVLTVFRLLAAQLYDFPRLVERISGELPISLSPQGELFATWRKKA